MSELAVGSLSGLAANSYVIDVASGSQLTQPGMVLQVVSTTKTDTFSTTSSSFTDVTGMSATITPTSTSSKILILFSGNLGLENTSNNSGSLRLSGGSASDYLGDADGSKVQAVTGGLQQKADLNPAASITPVNMNYLDSPSSTSAQTYSVQIRANVGGTIYFNRVGSENDSSEYNRYASTITVMEIAG